MIYNNTNNHPTVKLLKKKGWKPIKLLMVNS